MFISFAQANGLAESPVKEGIPGHRFSPPLQLGSPSFSITAAATPLAGRASASDPYSIFYGHKRDQGNAWFSPVVSVVSVLMNSNSSRRYRKFDNLVRQHRLETISDMYVGS